MNVFITGASGYIGGTVAMHLLKLGHKITGLTRTQNGADQLTRLGITPAIGSLDDSAVLTREASAADAVINAANADHLVAVETLVAALQGSGKAFVHTSGSSIIGDDARGTCSTTAIYSEDTPLLVDARKQARRDIDLVVLNAAKMNICSSVIIPSLVYGEGSGINQQSIQIPFLVLNAIEQKAVQLVGPGLNVWSNVHIEDLAILYGLVLNGLSSGSNSSTVPGSFYFAENGEASFIEIAQAISQRLNITTIEHLPAELAAEKWGAAKALFSLGSNSRVRSVRARSQLGWAPKHNSLAHWILHEMQVA
jgi:nucleoside-diphosphate-sugar epimerase